MPISKVARQLWDGLFLFWNAVCFWQVCSGQKLTRFLTNVSNVSPCCLPIRATPLSTRQANHGTNLILSGAVFNGAQGAILREP